MKHVCLIGEGPNPKAVLDIKIGENQCCVCKMVLGITLCVSVPVKINVFI
jgi:hypothetical protein